MFGPINVHRQGMTTIYRAAGLMQAEIVKGRLESAGIPVMLDYSNSRYLSSRLEPSA